MKKILFYYISPGNWFNVEPLYLALAKNHDCTLDVLALNAYPMFNATPQNDNPEKLTPANVDYLVQKGFDHIMQDDFDWEGTDYDLLVCAYPYEDCFTPEFRVKYVKKYVRKILYIPYGIEFSVGGMLDQAAYKLDIHNIADAFICQSESTKQNFIKHNPSVKDRIFATGLPRFDAITHLTDRKVNQSLNDQVDGRFCVLWNTHFSFVLDRWSCFDRMINHFAEFVIKHPDIAFIFRPHPNIKMVLTDLNFCGVIDYQMFLKDLASLGMIIDQTNSHLDSFALSDCFLTDGSSLFFEYLGTKKPMALLKNPNFDLDYVPDVKKALMVYDSFDDAACALDYVLELKSGVDKKQKIRSLVNSYIKPGFDGKSTERVLALAYDLLEASNV